jgi:[acyl-carrier-protein] S-malonyltransferase
MGREFYDRSLAARKYFDDAERLLDFKIAKLCFLGPKEEQDKLVNAHVGVFVNDVAFFELMVANRRKAELLTGVGVGEIAALVVAEAIPYPNALQFIHQRAKQLEILLSGHPWINLQVAGLTMENLLPALSRAEGEIIITHHLSPENFAVYGPREAVESLEVELKGVPKVHTGRLLQRGPLFTQELQKWEHTLDVTFNECFQDVKFHNPKITVHRASDGMPVYTPDDVVKLIKTQLFNPVRWDLVVKNVCDRGFRTWVECGPGKVYSSLVKKNDANNRVTNVEDVKSLALMVKLTV